MMGTQGLTDTDKVEETLDPQDWESMRELGHRMIEDMMSYLKDVRRRPVWQSVPESSKRAMDRPLPREPEGAEKTYADFLSLVLPYATGNIHPRFWGWVMGSGTPLGMLADMLAAGMNSNVGGGEHIANYVESQVISWCKEMLGFPASASGLLVSGGSMANLVGLTVARNAKAGFDVRRLGVSGADRLMTIYGSVQTHSSVQKAIELLGLGNEAFRQVPVTQDFRIDLPLLKEALHRDRAAGFRPISIVGNAGTVNTGAFDDLDSLADIARNEGMWFHVDGAFGALAALAPGLRHYTSGMERADSLALDLHKWMHMPYEVGCALVRDESLHRQAFSLTPDYLAHGGGRGMAGNSIWFSDYGVELSRSFKALKVWMSMKEHGIQKFARLVQQNVDQAQYLASRIDQSRNLERLAPSPLNIVCFRYTDPRLDDTALNALNEEILLQLHESGLAGPSYARLDGKYALRVNITNHRSRRDDLDMFLKEVVRLGDNLAGQSPGRTKMPG